MIGLSKTIEGRKTGAYDNEDGQSESRWVGALADLKVDEQMYDGAEPLNGFGGKVVQGVHAIGPHGCRALIEDSEGNPMALLSTEEA